MTPDTFYIGSNAVVGASVSDRTTPTGGRVLQIMFENSPSIFMPEKTYELVRTTEPKDEGYVQNTKFNAMLPELIGIIAEYDIKLFEVEALVRLVVEHLQKSFDRAFNFLLTKDDSRWVQGISPLMESTILDAHTIISNIPTTDGSTTSEKTAS